MAARERLVAGLAANGTRVHLARADGSPICGSNVIAGCRVVARITCPQCRVKRPKKAARLDGRPHVVGVNWSPFYAALRRALAAGAVSEPRVKVRFWPVLARTRPGTLELNPVESRQASHRRIQVARPKTARNRA